MRWPIRNQILVPVLAVAILSLLAVGAMFGFAGDLGATLLFATAGIAALIITSITRYSAGTAT